MSRRSITSATPLQETSTFDVGFVCKIKDARMLAFRFAARLDNEAFMADIEAGDDFAILEHVKAAVPVLRSLRDGMQARVKLHRRRTTFLFALAKSEREVDDIENLIKKFQAITGNPATNKFQGMPISGLMRLINDYKRAQHAVDNRDSLGN